jgi:hypothetical protein
LFFLFLDGVLKVRKGLGVGGGLFFLFLFLFFFSSEPAIGQAEKEKLIQEKTPAARLLPHLFDALLHFFKSLRQAEESRVRPGHRQNVQPTYFAGSKIGEPR